MMVGPIVRSRVETGQWISSHCPDRCFHSTIEMLWWRRRGGLRRVVGLWRAGGGVWSHCRFWRGIWMRSRLRWADVFILEATIDLAAVGDEADVDEAAWVVDEVG